MLYFRRLLISNCKRLCKIMGDVPAVSSANASSVATNGSKPFVDVIPEYIPPREELWQRLKAEHHAAVERKDKVAIKISYEGKEHKVVDGVAWQSTPLQIGKMVDKKFANECIISRVNNELWDLDRPLEGDCTLRLVRFEDDDEAKAVFWHSTAHVLGEAMERYFGGLLCYGPPIADGFYYDMCMHGGRSVVAEDYAPIEQLMTKIVEERQPFERLEMTREQLLSMFHYNQFKCRIINEKIDTPTTTAYKCGTLIDLCRGPHVPHTGILKALSVIKNSATYWEGDCNAESLQRVYGISYPDMKQLKEWKRIQEEAAKRDHRLIGRQQELFFFHELSPGSCFFLPKGTVIYNRLVEWIRELYLKHGYSEVISPNMFNTKLWEVSGHLAHYAENMFQFDVEKQKFALKPMNCPGHCLMYDVRPRSKHELPIRMAEFGVLHRNEMSGALHGLTRVRRFVQDDSHIFCAQDQIGDEINGCLKFFKHVYCDVLGFTDFMLYLSTRPEKYMGELSVWDSAEKELKSCLDGFGHPWKLNPGDGAFYGPKIDIVFTDALRRQHQCTTIQLDFQLPERFNLWYVDTDEAQTRRRPVIIHRAILGSAERFIGVFAESCAGKWPFWLSPQQISVVPVNSEVPKCQDLVDYAKKLEKTFIENGFLAEANNDPTQTMNKKIRNAQLAQFNFILVVGQNELANGTVNIRTRDNKVHGERKVEDVLARFIELRRDRVKDAEEKL